ncbi:MULTISPECIES: DUF4407 domain-containing protein [unclassified Amycolatopsis]|uniref:DUF4407 domain-containing protein n=1 Tax=unclassified Amycolatopsis TaxID=2618356 RepID=UPI0028768836|nr:MULTISPECIES: DUF4407 domain-containing protein [unclassified Amycolatopsis]MDS0132736.1 DUF4407 domain-containing protein [Amycolatopsis sp. 505]MDS0142439.1 DUF4407 domain-containing protein [Amycolatopsis sp. CM201R]
MTKSSGQATTPERRFGDTLTWIGGADRDILLTAPTNRSSFVQMGLVVLATAGLGVLSMSFALSNGVHLPVALSVFGGLVWGCIIAVIDRFLIMNLKLRGGFAKALTVVGVRVVIAALLGIVISTPLVLQIFHDEISAQIISDNLTKAKETGDVLAETPAVKLLAQTREKIAVHENTLRGVLPAADSPEVKNRQDYLDKARQDYDKARTAAEAKYRAWQCELYGSSCEGSTNVPGNGNLAKAREREYQEAQRLADDAGKAVTQAEGALTAARESVSTQGQNALGKAQEVARAELPGLRQQEAALQAQVSGQVNDVTTKNDENQGLLAQIIALSNLGKDNGAAASTHYAVAGLLFMIELLPVLVKILTSLGPPSAYERNRDAAEDTDVENAKIEKRKQARDRDEAERRAAEEVKKEGAVVDDMRSREQDLGIKANERVAKEMETILDAALAQWARDVQKTLHTAAGAAGKPAGANGSAGGGHVPPQATGSGQQNVRSKFNLPNGKKIGSTNGSTP